MRKGRYLTSLCRLFGKLAGHARIGGCFANAASQPIKKGPLSPAGAVAQLLQQRLNVLALHQKVFPKYKNCHYGREVVLLGAGPSLNFYQPIPGAVHIGVNKVFLFDRVRLDYYFTADYTSTYYDKLALYDEPQVKRFYGILDPSISLEWIIPESLAIKHGAERYYTISHWRHPPLRYALHLESEPLGCNGSIAFPAMQFALYSNPRKIYIAGCDCSSDGHFNGEPQVAGKEFLDTTNRPRLLYGWQKMKEFAQIWYPETEIISINPVGLKGLFSDMYTVDRQLLRNNAGASLDYNGNQHEPA